MSYPPKKKKKRGYHWRANFIGYSSCCGPCGPCGETLRMYFFSIIYIGAILFGHWKVKTSQCFEQCLPNSHIAEWSSKHIFSVFGHYILKWVTKRSLNREINLAAHISNFSTDRNYGPVWYPYLNNNFHISNTLTHFFTHIYF